MKSTIATKSRGGRARLLGLAAAATLAATIAPGATAQGSLKVGIVGFYTGAAAGPFGIPARNAAELVIEAMNAGKVPAPYQSAGAGGLQIDAVYIDESGGTAKVVTDYRNAVQRQGVEAFVGYISSGSCLAIAPVAEELATFTILFDCGTPRIFEDASYTYVFRTAATATMDGVGAARYVAAKFPDIKNYQGINQNYAWGQDSWRDFELAMKALLPNAKSEDSLFPKLFAGQYGAEISSLSVKRPNVLHSSLWGGDLESFVLQSSARALNRQTTMILTTGETTMFRLGSKLPDGIILGARGPYGVYARDSELNTWFRNAYQDRFATPPTYPSYQMAQALLGLKIAYDKAATAAGGSKPTSAQAADGLAGAEYEAFGTTVKMALGNGRQAITETAYGLSKFDKETGTATITDIIRFPAECVNPPDGAKSVEWIQGGMQGAKCD
ncbi:MAG: ABC transporter substrate-binding protein [Ectothiorhodospiraceae bacterium]|nr:ABC transporter substrate-binding protein [Ectothiorhodospiraceae bacterium]